MSEEVMIHGLTVMSIVAGMREARDHEAPCMKNLALYVGAIALEKLLAEHEQTVRALNQCVRATLDDAPAPHG